MAVGAGQRPDGRVPPDRLVDLGAQVDQVLPQAGLEAVDRQLRPGVVDQGLGLLDQLPQPANSGRSRPK